jgi:hypothetical protein
MAPTHPYRRLSDHLILAADALLLTVLAAAALIIVKDLAAVPAAWLDPMDAFLITVTIASVMGATASWLVHRAPTGLRGLWMLAVGLLVATPVLLGAHWIVARASAASSSLEITALLCAQIVGLAVLLPPLVAGAVDLVQPKKRKFSPVAVVRLAALVALVGLVAFRFIPGTMADPATAHLYAMLGLATTAGALGTGIADAILFFSDHRAERRRMAVAEASTEAV